MTQFVFDSITFLVSALVALAFSVVGIIKKSAALTKIGQRFGVVILLFIFLYLALHR